MKRVAIYLRVSTKDDSQDTANQMHQLQAECDRQGWQIVETFQDKESGTKGRRERKEFDRMFNECGKRRFDVVVCWSLDRFSREGTRQVMNYMALLESHGVSFFFLKDDILNTENEIIRPIVLSVIATFAAYESKRISERTKAGLETARRKGKELGRPSKVKMYRDRVAEILQSGSLSVAEVHRRLNDSLPTGYQAAGVRTVGKIVKDISLSTTEREVS